MKKRVASITCLWLTVACPALATSPPWLNATANFQNQAVEIGHGVTFVPEVSGDGPLSFQWRLNGRNLAGQTQSALVISTTRESDEGDYTLVVTNAYGSVASEAIRLWVVPPASHFVKAAFTDHQSVLPYFYLLPAGYSATRKYTLFVWLHGAHTDERTIVAPEGAPFRERFTAEIPNLKVMASARRQETDPTILIWPTRHAGEPHWTGEHVELIVRLLDRFQRDFSVDTNRIYLGAFSDGVHAAWDISAMRPGLFAGALFFDGWSGTAQVAALKDLPVWVFHAATDPVVDVRHSRAMVEALRHVGGKPIYTEYPSGGHGDPPRIGLATPAVEEWLSAQRRTGSPLNPIDKK